MTQGDTWQGVKPLLLGQIPPQHTAVRELSLDFPELLFISPLLHPLTGTTNQFTLTDETAGNLLNSHSFKTGQSRAVPEHNTN